jgi:NADPH-dependent glutamate synthase beta subunit-like oxidoreductase/ferredoxin
MLRYGVSEDELPPDVLDAEIDIIRKIGADIKCGISIGDDIEFDQLRADYDAVFFAVGRIDLEKAEAFGFETTERGIAFEANTYRTNLEGVFAGGDVIRQRKLAVRACGDGKEAAVAIDQFLSGSEVTGQTRIFNSQIGKIDTDEAKAFMKGISDQQRIEMSKTGAGFTDSEAIAEAKRCMHCDCRKPVSCKLRKYSCEYEVKKNRYKDKRRQFVQYDHHPEVIYEPGKCIDCGLCIQIASKYSEKLGLSFVGRGFDVKVAVPFGRDLADGLQKAAQKCVENCPTGALSFKKDVEIY